MSNDSVTVFWIEADTFEFCSKSLSSANLTRGATYISEAISKYARDPLESYILVIPFNQLGSDWAKSQVQRLKDKSAALRKSVGQ